MKCYIVHFKAEGARYSMRVYAYSAEKAVKVVTDTLGGDAYTISRVREVAENGNG